MTEPIYFPFGSTEVEYLSARDPVLGNAIARIGHINRECNPDPFYSVVRGIVSQLISKKAQITVMGRLEAALGGITPETVLRTDADSLQALGMTFRKAENIMAFAQRIAEGSFDLNALRTMSDAEAIAALSSLKGIGVWTAEMLLLFCFRRPDIMSRRDLAIVRGLRILHGLETVDKATFETYRALYSPYGSTASLYLWELSHDGNSAGIG